MSISRYGKKWALPLVALLTGLCVHRAVHAQQEWRKTSCLIWKNKALVDRKECYVAWGASRPMAISYKLDQNEAMSITARPYENGWIYDENIDCLKNPGRGEKICAKVTSE